MGNSQPSQNVKLLTCTHRRHCFLLNPNIFLVLNLIKNEINGLPNRLSQIWCCSIKFSDQTEGYGQTGKEDQVTILDLQNVHFLPYMEMALTFRPSQWISLGLPSESAVSLDLGLSIYEIFRGCVLYKYSPRPQIASKPWEWMEISITLTAKVGGEGIQFPWIGVLFGST